MKKKCKKCYFGNNYIIGCRYDGCIINQNTTERDSINCIEELSKELQISKDRINELESVLINIRGEIEDLEIN